MSRPLSALTLGALGALALAACAHQKPSVASTAPLPAVPVAAPAAAPPAVAAAPAPLACSTDLQCATNELCLEGGCRTISASLAACGVSRLHFDYDQAELHPAELSTLQRLARCIQAEQPAHVLIDGNADERGTVEYNLALGQRRAGAVKRYLEDLGVPGPRLSLVTYGKELPLCTEHDEACWQRNRRAGVHIGETARNLMDRVKADEARERAGAAGAKPTGG